MSHTHTHMLTIHNASFDEESAICDEAKKSYQCSGKVKYGLWSNGKIYFKLGIFTSPGLHRKARQAIKEWNKVNGSYCQFISIDDEPSTYYPYYVTFEEVYSGCPRANVGCMYDISQRILLPERYPGGSEVKVVCILHEMMHCAGFIHEHCRNDRNGHCIVKSSDHNFVIQGVCVGSYDYYSIMHYGKVPGMDFSNEELRRLADRSLTFSAGDRAAIKLMYAPKGTHHGEWHKPSMWTMMFGHCELRKGGSSCGYLGKKGHWTCCLEEDENSKCKTTHTGFWHAQCVKKGCTEQVCYCNKCGGGCTYEGLKGHWNCCNEERLVSECKKPFKKIL